MTSPSTGGELPSGVTPVGGIVLDLIGLNGVRVVVQVSANQLFEGVFSPSDGNPGLIGVLGGLSPQVLAQLGGGLSQMAVRLSVFDADASVGDVDFNDNFLTLNGVQIGNLSSPETQSTTESGELLGSAKGFQNAALSTGWFLVTDGSLLAQVFDSLIADNQASFGLRDLDPFDNGYDFTQGVEGSHFEITLPNVAPDGNDDAYVVSRNGQLVVDAETGVLANDTDPEGANLTATLIDGPVHGVVTLNADGSFSYRPNPGYSGPDRFTYRVGDGALGDVATVNLTVDPNVAPVAGADAYTLDRNGHLVVTTSDGVLANDVDPDGSGGGILVATVVEGPQNGTLTFNADGSFTYTPNPGFHGVDSFRYSASDGDAATPTTVTLNVVNTNAAPEATDDAYQVDKNGALVVDAGQGVLANDVDADGDVLTAEVVRGPAHGVLTVNADGSFTYTPNQGFHGSDSFTYRVGDGQDGEVATVDLTVNNPNTAPTPADDVYEVDENGSLSIDATAGLLSNDADPDGSPLTAQIRTRPSSGTVTIAEDGSFVYTPNPGFVGTDSFTYFANDGSDTGFATVTLTVKAVNEAPVGVADAYALDLNGRLVVDADHGVLANDRDPDGDALSATLLTGPRHGVFALNRDGSFSYVPDADFTGTDTFTYALRDGTDSAPVTVTLTVNPPAGRVVTLDDGDNTASFRNSKEAVSVFALGGEDRVTGSRFNDTLVLGDGDDEAGGGAGDDRILGGRGDDRIFGDGGRDILEGGDGDDTLHGGAGADDMAGGAGDDLYYVDSAGDRIDEGADKGWDVVRSSVSLTLGANLEDLFLEGEADLDGAGNALDNAVIGNSGVNTLRGLDGNDTLNGFEGDDSLFGGNGDDRLVGIEGDDLLVGGAGDDTYYVDGGADAIVEEAGEGWDMVFSTGSYAAHDNVEGVRLEGEADIDATGNALDNFLGGNEGANTLDGGLGDDDLSADGGDDVVIGGQGDDRLSGGSGSDVLNGGDGIDLLYGGDGHDVLRGGSSFDLYEGGSGDDLFVFHADDFRDMDGEIDNIVDFHGAGSSGEGEQDILVFEGFGAGASLVFDHYSFDRGGQYYRIVDPEHPGIERMILVQTPGTTDLLTSSDYMFA